MSHEDYRSWYDKHDEVYIILADEKIYTKVKRQEMFDKGLHYGCFIEHEPRTTPEEVRKDALELANSLNCMFVSPDEFKTIEKAKEQQRTTRAFMTAEMLIARG